MMQSFSHVCVDWWWDSVGNAWILHKLWQVLTKNERHIHYGRYHVKQSDRKSDCLCTKDNRCYSTSTAMLWLKHPLIYTETSTLTERVTVYAQKTIDAIVLQQQCCDSNTCSFTLRHQHICHFAKFQPSSSITLGDRRVYPKFGLGHHIP